MPITSLHNQRIKDAIKLRDRRQRDKQGRTVIDGVRELARAYEAGIELLEVFLCDDLLDEPATSLAQDLRAVGVLLTEVSEPVFHKLAFGQRSEGLVGIARTPTSNLADLATRITAEAPLIAVLEAVEKPGNLGAVLRSADAAGLSAVLLAQPLTDLYNPAVIRASLGTVFDIPTATASAEQTLTWLREHHFQMVAARVDGTASHWQIDYRRATVIILGSEATGLTPAWHTHDVTPIRIPMQGIADSLNVSTAAAVLFYEALRQRQPGQSNPSSGSESR